MDDEKCCELISKKDWDNKTVKWKNKLFVKKHYFAFFYMPLGLDKALDTIMKHLHAKNNLAEEAPIMVWRNEGMFGGDVYIAVKEKDSKYETDTISGTFVTRFYEGKDYKDVGNWFKLFKADVKDTKEIISFYALCPGCAKKFGKVQGALFGRIE
ncbi:hypothetical protein KKE92_06570 [Candidatus Micrarchaeota archaeon]|nr:hypothetical protein [Candidatus Micrarchaeota archaeon]MBU1682257.1 hypothetical protein [Candidatus Micrarchaeota archaeon]